MSEYSEHIYGVVPVTYSDGTFMGGKLERREGIVRCRDCVYRSAIDKTCGLNREVGVSDNHFCAWGKKRTKADS